MKKILEVKFGSHLYGTNTSESDLDFKAIYLPEAKDIVLGKYKKTIQISKNKEKFEKNNPGDIDIEIFSLDRFLELLMEGQTVALDLLFAPEELYTYSTKEGEHLMRIIKANKAKLITRNVNAFLGYAKQQANKYGIKGSRIEAITKTLSFLDGLCDVGYKNNKLSLYSDKIDLLIGECKELISLEKTPLVEKVLLKGPTGLTDSPHLRINGRSIPFHATIKYARDQVKKLLDNYGTRAHKAHIEGGIDWKALSHAVRVNSEAIELLNTGNITFPRPDKDLLLNIKNGRLSYEEVANIIENGLANAYEAYNNSKLRELPDLAWSEDFIYNTYSRIVKSTK